MHAESVSAKASGHEHFLRSHQYQTSPIQIQDELDITMQSHGLLSTSRASMSRSFTFIISVLGSNTTEHEHNRSTFCLCSGSGTQSCLPAKWSEMRLLCLVHKSVISVVLVMLLSRSPPGKLRLTLHVLSFHWHTAVFWLSSLFLSCRQATERPNSCRHRRCGRDLRRLCIFWICSE